MSLMIPPQIPQRFINDCIGIQFRSDDKQVMTTSKKKKKPLLLATQHLGLMRYLCLFVSKKTTNNAVCSQQRLL